jgi:hypothetical protein
MDMTPRNDSTLIQSITMELETALHRTLQVPWEETIIANSESGHVFSYIRGHICCDRIVNEQGLHKVWVMLLVQAHDFATYLLPDFRIDVEGKTFTLIKAGESFLAAEFCLASGTQQMRLVKTPKVTGVRS